MPTWCNKVIFLMCSKLDMFRVHTPVIMSIRCWVAAYGFLHRVSGWVVVLKAAAWVVCTVRMVHGTIRTVHTTHAAAFNIQCSWWWAYVPETCLAKNILRKVPCCIKLAFQVSSIYVVCSTKLYSHHNSQFIKSISCISSYMFVCTIVGARKTPTIVHTKHSEV